MNERDIALEDAAQAVEHPDFLSFCGILAKTKKGQREYEIRSEAIADTKRRMASYIRSLKGGRGNDIRVSLMRATGADGPIIGTRDLWQMADLGWLKVFVTLEATSNGYPARAEYRVELTNRGRRVLDELRSETTPQPDPRPNLGER